MCSALLSLLLNKLLLLSIGHWKMYWNLGHDPAWDSGILPLTHKPQSAIIYGANCSLIWVFLSHTSLQVYTDLNLQCQEKGWLKELSFPLWECVQMPKSLIFYCAEIFSWENRNGWNSSFPIGPTVTLLAEALLGAELLHITSHHRAGRDSLTLLSTWDDPMGTPQADLCGP